MSDDLYAAMQAARQESDRADDYCGHVADEFGLFSNEFVNAEAERERCFAVWLAARDAYEAAQDSDPMNDVNYVGHPIHY